MAADIWAVGPGGTRVTGISQALSHRNGEEEVKGTVFCSQPSAKGKLSLPRCWERLLMSLQLAGSCSLASFCSWNPRCCTSSSLLIGVPASCKYVQKEYCILLLGYLLIVYLNFASFRPEFLLKLTNV